VFSVQGQLKGIQQCANACQEQGGQSSAVSQKLVVESLWLKAVVEGGCYETDHERRVSIAFNISGLGWSCAGGSFRILEKSAARVQG
jgi:hypothetical protein